MLYATILKFARLMIEGENYKKQDCLEIKQYCIYMQNIIL